MRMDLNLHIWIQGLPTATDELLVKTFQRTSDFFGTGCFLEAKLFFRKDSIQTSIDAHWLD